jgi:hypothetical protein
MHAFLEVSHHEVRPSSPGYAPHQTVEDRTASHHSPTALVKQPNSPYYNVKYSTTSPCQSLFVSLVRIPIPPNLNPEEKALRRLLCRLAEAMFAYWLCAFGSTGKGSHLFPFAAKLNTDIYDDAQPEWMGTLTHSPLTEQLGTEEFGTVRQSRFKDLMVEYHTIYGINVPDDMVMLAGDRSRFDTLRQRQDKTRSVKAHR